MAKDKQPITHKKPKSKAMRRAPSKILNFTLPPSFVFWYIP
jgi:hypothetical protein